MVILPCVSVTEWLYENSVTPAREVANVFAPIFRAIVAVAFVWTLIRIDSPSLIKKSDDEGDAKPTANESVKLMNLSAVWPLDQSRPFKSTPTLFISDAGLLKKVVAVSVAEYRLGFAVDRVTLAASWALVAGFTLVGAFTSLASLSSQAHSHTSLRFLDAK